MGRRTHKISRGHHNKTNAKNILINQGRADYWKNHWRKKRTREIKKRKRIQKEKIRSLIEDFILLILFLGFITLICFANGIKKDLF